MRARTITTTVLLLLAAATARADWPTDPAAPLVVGPINNGFDERAAIKPATDGSVWLCWQNNYCVGELLFQHVTLDGQLLNPDAVAIQDDPTCGFHLPPLLIPLGADSAIASRAQSSLMDTPIQRFDDVGLPLWSPPYSTQDPLQLGEAAQLTGGDLLIVARGGSTIHADRLDPDGQRVWDNPSIFATNTGSNFRILGVVPDPSGGAFIFWDSHLTYTKVISAMRLNPDGTSAWSEPVRITPNVINGVTSSRHTTPAVISDNQGGAIVVFAEGFEAGSTPAPLLMQRLNPDGTLGFDPNAVRIADGAQRQFDPIVQQEPDSGDLIIVWRNGYLDGQSVRAQRITADAQRLWDESGIEVAPLERDTGSYDAVFNNHRLSVALADAQSVHLHRFDAQGLPAGATVTVATGTVSSFVKIAPSGAGSVLAWQVDTPGSLDDALVAQRVNRLGTLGNEPCSPADITNDGTLNFFDVSAFLNGFTSTDPAADINNDGVFNFFDVSAFLAAYSAGCP